MTDIFISYASGDRPRAKSLVDGLHKLGWSVWWDRTIHAGKSFHQVIETALSESRCVVVLWSQASILSNWVRDEADAGMKRGVLIPALLDQVTIPIGFRAIQTANLIEWDGSSSHPAFDELVRGISEVLSSADSPASLSVPADKSVSSQLETLAGPVPAAAGAGRQSASRQKTQKRTSPAREKKRTEHVFAVGSPAKDFRKPTRAFLPTRCKQLFTLDHGGRCVAWSPDGGLLATGGDGVRVWRTQTGLEVRRLESAGDVRNLVWTKRGLAVAGSGFRATVWDVSTDQASLVVKRSAGVKAWSPDGTLLATETKEGTVTLTDISTGRESVVLRGHQGNVMDIAWSPNGRTLAVTSLEDYPARIWDVVTGKELLALPEGHHTNLVWSVAWSPDGNRLATGSFDKTMKVWAAATGKELLSVGHGDSVMCLAWSPDGRLLATGGGKVAKVWDTAGGTELLTLKGHREQVNHVAWAPDGKRLATASADGKTRIWVFEP